MIIPRLIYWKIKDAINGYKNRKDKKPHLYGIYGFFGLPGHGKTISMTYELMNLRRSYGDNIYIYLLIMDLKKKIGHLIIGECY